MHWTWTRFDDLGVADLYDILALRCRVFVLEQGPYLDPDGLDRTAGTCSAATTAGVLQAYLRVVDPGIKYAEPSIGRVITAPEVRGSGLGRTLMREGLARCAAQWPGQRHPHQRAGAAARFYAGLGFDAVGDEYLEDDIPHLRDAEEAVMSITHEVTNQTTPLADVEPVRAEPAAAGRAGLAPPRASTVRASTHWAPRPAAPRCRRMRGWPTTMRRCCTRTTASATASTRSSSTPATTRCWAAALRHGLHGTPWTEGAGGHIERAAAFMLFTEAEPSVLCPVSMSYAVTPALRAKPALFRRLAAQAGEHVLRRALRALRAEDGRHHGHGHDREAGRLGRARQHHARRVRRR